MAYEANSRYVRVQVTRHSPARTCTRAISIIFIKRLERGDVKRSMH